MRVLTLVLPPVLAWLMALSGAFVQPGWMAPSFKEPDLPTVPSADVLQNSAAEDVVISIPRGASAVLAALLCGLVVEVTKLGWIEASRPSQGRLLPALGLYSLALAFQLELVREAIRYWHHPWWSWLLWQLGFAGLPPAPLAGSRLLAFLPSGLMLLTLVGGTALYLHRVLAGDRRKPT